MKQRATIGVIGAYLVGLVFVYSWFGITTDSTRYNSPDETANAYFISRSIDGESLYYTEPLNTVANQLIHPRSTNTVDTRVLPGSFLGMIFIYGSIGSVLGEWVVPYLTPVFAAVGILFFGLLVSFVFGKRVGVLSALLASTFASWVYFASRGMYHNVLFVSLLIVGLYFLVRFLAVKVPPMKYPVTQFYRWRKWFVRQKIRSSHALLFALLAGMFVGLALTVRMSEIGWVGVLVAALVLARFRHVYIPGVVLFVGALVTMFVPVFATNMQLYGSPLSIGYGSVSGGDVAGVLGSFGLEGLFKLVFVPFGWHLGQLKLTVQNYVFGIFWWWALLTGVGGLYWLLRGRWRDGALVRRQTVYMACYLSVGVALLVLYGSWGLVDRIDQSQYSIGTSFARYLLPLYLGAIPFGALLVTRVVTGLKQSLARALFVCAVFALFSYPSFRLAYLDTDESLLAVQETLVSYEQRAQVFKEVLPENAVYITYPQLDKVLFPERARMITALAVPRDYEAVRDLVSLGPVYYVTFASPDIVAERSRDEYEPYGMQLEFVRDVDAWDFLYRVVPLDPEPQSNEV